MYDYFIGKLIEKTTLYTVIETNNIGYKFLTPTSAVGKLPDLGKTVKLYGAWIVREMSQALYGFVIREERDLFEQLLTISGIGPKTALNLVGHFEIPMLEEIVRKGNVSALAKVPGIGKKSAEKLILDLKNKLKLTAFSGHSSFHLLTEDALNALLRLGCTQTVAENAIKRALDELPQPDLPSLITLALKFSR
jgi:holliday junction DNA helicase RuvA